MCWLMQVDLYNGRTTVVVVLLCVLMFAVETVVAQCLMMLKLMFMLQPLF